MIFLTKFIAFWQKPFSKTETWFGLSKNFISISVFTTFFLYIFQPNGLSNAEPKFLICLGFGISGALGYFLYELTFSLFIKIIRSPIEWTYGKWWLYCIGALFFISLTGFLYVRYFVFGFMIWALFPAMLKGTFMFGIPILATITMVLLRDEQKYQTIAAEINYQNNHTAKINATNHLTLFDIPINEIRYVEALQNYITIGFINATGQLKTKTERSTLKSILEKTKESAIVKTHRSFLVNKEAITKVEGNSQGLQLTLSDCDKKIPVSRNYVPTFRPS